jgi:hypothetical protein
VSEAMRREVQGELRRRSLPSYNSPPFEASMCCRASFQRLLFCFLVLSLVGCDQNPQRKPLEQARESREEVEKELEDAKKSGI